MEKLKLINDDSINYLKSLPDKSIDLILTDPPYGINYLSKSEKFKYKKIKNDDTAEFLESYMKELERVLKDDTHIYIFCSWHNIDIFKQEMQKHFKIKNMLVWEKNSFGRGDCLGAYAPQHELILFAHKGRRLLKGKRIPDIIKEKKVKCEYHPTQKPVELLKVFIEKSTEVGETVLDPFMGSGSTGIAALESGRKFIGIEIEKEYFETAKKRLAS